LPAVKGVARLAGIFGGHSIAGGEWRRHCIQRERERDKGLTEVSELHYRPIADAAGFGRAHLNISERRDIQVAPSAGTRVNESSYLATNGQHAEEDFQARPIENLQISSKRTQLKESR
jgi:hypothetical protein